MSNPDPRAVAEFRIPAASLKAGDLVNLSPGEDDWQQVLGAYSSVEDVVDPSQTELIDLVTSLDGRYVVVQLTDILPVDAPIYFVDGAALTVGEDDADDQPVADLISTEDGTRTFVYTKFELVSARSSS